MFVDVLKKVQQTAYAAMNSASQPARVAKHEREKRQFAVAAFLPRDARVHSAVLRLHVVCLSVCPFVRLSVTLVDQDHIGWKSWKLCRTDN